MSLFIASLILSFSSRILLSVSVSSLTLMNSSSILPASVSRSLMMQVSNCCIWNTDSHNTLPWTLKLYLMSFVIQYLALWINRAVKDLYLHSDSTSVFTVKMNGSLYRISFKFPVGGLRQFNMHLNIQHALKDITLFSWFKNQPITLLFGIYWVSAFVEIPFRV